MKTLRLLLVTALWVTLCTGFYSCDDDTLDGFGEETVRVETMYDGYINPEDYDCLEGIQRNKDGRLLISGLKDKHLWFGVFEYGGSKTKLYEWIDPETTNRIQNLYIGYGEYKELSLYSIGLYELEEVVTSGFISRSLLRYGEKPEDSRIKWMLIFKSLNSVKKIYSDWVTSTKFEPMRQWYESSWIIDNCCYSSKGDTIFTPKIIPSANDNPVSFKEGIHIDEQTITRINYEDSKIIWKSEVTPPFQVASNCRYAFTLQDNSTSNWKYKVDVTYYNGTKKDFTFTINIENGETLVEGIKVTGITLNNNMVELDIIDTFQFLANIQPADATNKNVTWKSSNEEVATIYQNGLLTAKSPGEATITATTEDGGFTASSTIIVKMRQDISAYIEADINPDGNNSMGQFIGVVNCKITNNSSEIITLVSIEIINGGSTTIYSKHYDDKVVNPKGNHSESVQGLPTLYTPTVKWTYKYNNQEYIISKTSVK